MTEMVLSSNIYNTRKKSVLRIDMVEEELQGDYQCIAANQLGNTTQQTKLIVHCKYMLQNWMQYDTTHCNMVQHIAS